MFFGGLFAYDLAAALKRLSHWFRGCGNNCPDYRFLFTETLMVIDHQKSTGIQRQSVHRQLKTAPERPPGAP